MIRLSDLMPKKEVKYMKEELDYITTILICAGMSQVVVSLLTRNFVIFSTGIGIAGAGLGFLLGKKLYKVLT
jgi:hypothetical protein